MAIAAQAVAQAGGGLPAAPLAERSEALRCA